MVNRQLPNLQINGLTASYQTSGLVATCLMDNGNEFTSLYPTPVPWQLKDGGDGSRVLFLRNGHLLHFNNTTPWNNIEYGNRVRDARWDPASSQLKDEQYFPNPPLSWGVIPLDGTNDGLGFPNDLEIVNDPAWKNAQGEPMWAVAGKDYQLYGVFAGASGGLHWTLLGKIPA